MSDKLDDLDAVRTIVDTLSKFDSDTQERILRWTREKLGLKVIALPEALAQSNPKLQTGLSATSDNLLLHRSHSTDIKTFVDLKNPSSQNEFTATVVYYYRFEAPDTDRKESITADDLQEACRLSGRPRLTKPSQTLINAHRDGFLDKAGDRGAYSISTVGENLVAMALPSDGAIQKNNPIIRRKAVKKKVVVKAKKAAKKKPKGA
ncbi:MAG: hypothetical protein JST85_30640 [Acidobacteria bacterium]|nr:hypothetical protein [Acidobacteriota bacterium]